MGYRLSDLDAQWLLETFFFGIAIRDPATGKLYLANPTDKSSRLPEVICNDAIQAAIDALAIQLDADIRGVENAVEYKDYDSDLFADHMYVKTHHIPIATVTSLDITYGEQGPTIWSVPRENIQIKDNKGGLLRVLPYNNLNSGSWDPASYSYAFGSFGIGHAPSSIKLVYSYGMDLLPGDLDNDIVRAIGLLASIQPLNIMGDILIGAGIASISTSIDDLSQSVNTTASAENSAFSARIIMHGKELYGWTVSQPGLIHGLKTKWKRVTMGLL